VLFWLMLLQPVCLSRVLRCVGGCIWVPPVVVFVHKCGMSLDVETRQNPGL
jgi:hypothetical protein